MTPPRQCPISASPRDTPGALGGAQRAPPASKAGLLVRLFAPRGQHCSLPVSPAQPWPHAHNPAVARLQCCPNPTNFAKNSKITAQKGAKPLDAFVIIVLAVSLLDCQNHKHLNRGTQLWLKTKPRSTFSSGFLGAGKTTLIKKLIKEAFAGEKIVLIENEFGEIGIDGGFMREAGIQVNELNSGCICCSLVGDFREALKKVVETYHPDRILIEPSGVGKLSDVTRAVEGVAETPAGAAEQLCHRGRCQQGQNVYEELRRVL